MGIDTLPLPSEWVTRPETAVVLLVTGGVLLLFGRRLFWLFVGLVGAVAALVIATEWVGLEAGTPSLLAAVAAGLVGALLAVLVQKAAVAVVGFLAGVWGVLVLLQMASPSASLFDPPSLQTLLALAGGVVGAVVAAQVFDAALVVLSALTGSLLLVTGSGLVGTFALISFFALAFLGVLAQTRGRRERRRRRVREVEG